MKRLQEIDTLATIKRITKTDAKHLIEHYGSIENIVLCEDYNDFGEFKGMGQSKIESLLLTFKGNFDPYKKVTVLP